MRATTHEYQCVSCGLTLKGRENSRGEIVTTNAAPVGATRDMLCHLCQQLLKEEK